MPGNFDEGMTVLELKEALEEMPDTALVVFKHFNCDMEDTEYGWEFVHRCVFTVKKPSGFPKNVDMVELRVQ